MLQETQQLGTEVRRQQLVGLVQDQQRRAVRLHGVTTDQLALIRRREVKVEAGGLLRTHASA